MLAGRPAGPIPCMRGNGVENRFNNWKNVRPNAETGRKQQQQQTQMKRNSEIRIKIFSFERKRMCATR